MTYVLLDGIETKLEFGRHSCPLRGQLYVILYCTAKKMFCQSQHLQSLNIIYGVNILCTQREYTAIKNIHFHLSQDLEGQVLGQCAERCTCFRTKWFFFMPLTLGGSLKDKYLFLHLDRQPDFNSNI